MKILLIAGHGAGDPGATATYKGTKYREADETRNMVNLISAELVKQNIGVMKYQTDRNAYADTQAGTFLVIGKPKDYDYVLEIHFNAVRAESEDGKTKGVECYVTTAEKGITVEEKLCKAVASVGLTNRGVRRKNFSVINACKQAGTSSALLEICFIDDPDDMAVYIPNRQRIAKEIVKALCEGFGHQYKEAVTTNTATEQPSTWAKDACDWAVKNGLVKGKGNGKYGWKETLTREELCTILYRALNK